MPESMEEEMSDLGALLPNDPRVKEAQKELLSALVTKKPER